MGNFLTRNHKQVITLWEAGNPDGFGGRAYSAPVTIKGRWEDKEELFVDDKGQEARSKAVVYLGRDVKMEDWLYNGVSASTDPGNVDGAQEVRSFRKIPSISARIFERRIFL